MFKKMLIKIVCFSVMLWVVMGISGNAYCKYGSISNEVYEVQCCLSRLGYYDGKCDGIYGLMTENAVTEFQKDNDLNVDGIAGKVTLSKLGILNRKDIDLLAMIINGEARGESFEGQVAVGAVVMNRVKHPAFPDTISEVIYQKGAFSAVKDGQINKKITNSCRKAAEAALRGVDPTDGAVFYYNPDTATCKWIKTRIAVKRIGNHLFCV